MASVYAKGDLAKFLKRFSTIKRSNFTHTSIAKPSGSFYIPKDQEATFYELYRSAYKSGEDLYMIEKHTHLSPVLIDIDLRFPKDENLAHRYTQDDIETIIRVYISELVKELSIEKCSIYILEKPGASVDKNVIKDGLHIVIPDIVTRPAIQYRLRERVIPQLKSLFERMGATNDIKDVIDERVIEFVGWQMYGSKKPGGMPYKLAYLYTWTDEGFRLENKDSRDIVVDTLSIRNKHAETKIIPEKVDEIEAYEAFMYSEREKKKCVTNATQKNKQTTKNEYPYLPLVEALVGILKPERASGYDSWIRTGWCLRNIDHKLLPCWIAFSRHSPKFTEGECERHWDYMREDGLGIGTLHMWAKTDNPEMYKEIISKDLSELIKASLSKSHYDIAKVVHHMYQHQYVCTSIKNKQWYEFKNHRWNPCDGCYTLRSKISEEVYNEYLKLSIMFNTQALAGASDHEHLITKAGACNTIALKLKDTHFKENILKECADMFYMAKFEEKLDSRTNLVGFKDGVLDLDTLEFREGHPEDFISFSTGTQYREYVEGDSQTREIMRFISSILPKEDVREYVLKVMASCLDGAIREERFHIWTGVGSNGKSKLLELLMNSMGDYYCNMNVTAITGKRVSSNSTNSEIVRAKGKRALVMQEPGDDEKMNVGWMKELTGGDRIIARGLFKEPIEFKPQFKMILTCNHLPSVPAEDGGTWRRIRLVDFPSRFVENPDPSNPNEYQIDKELSGKFDMWRETFSGILIEYYRKYREEGTQEPDDVMECTKQYQRNNDAMGEYIEERTDKDEAGFITMLDIYNDCREWIRESNPGVKVPRRKDVQSYFEKTWGKMLNIGSRQGWKGVKLKATSFVEAREED